MTTEKLTIPDQSLVVPILVNKQIGNKRQDSAIVGVPIKIEQMDVPVIETVEVIDVPIKTIKRTTKKVDSFMTQLFLSIKFQLIRVTIFYKKMLNFH